MFDYVQGNGFRNLDAVHRSRQNAACVARALAGRIESGSVQALEVFPARDAHRRGSACLDPGQNRIIHGKALDIFLEGGDGFAQCFDHIVRQRCGEVSQMHARRIGWLHRAEFR